MQRIAIRSSDEQARIRARCQHPSQSFLRFKKSALDCALADRFEEQAAGHPQRVAVSFRSQRLTYNELNESCNRLARIIVERRGEQLENIIILCAPGINTIVAVIAALKAGKCYIPLDPLSPRTHLTTVRKHSNASLILTDSSHLDIANAISTTDTHFVNTDDLSDEIKSTNLGIALSPDYRACIYYTSGSTGKPKGVVDTHRNVLHNVMRYTNSLHVCAQDRLSMVHRLSSSASVSDMFGGLLNGARVCIFDLQEFAPGALSSWLRQERITIFHSVPSVFRHLLDGERRFPELRLVRLEGDNALPADIRRFQSIFEEHCILVNGLGTTECGLVSQHFFDKQSTVSDAVPIGFAVEDIELFLDTEEGDPVTSGEIGEIVVKSRYLARGYWQQPALTGEVFFTAANDSDDRLYRTRDVARVAHDGSLIHLRRCDATIKIRGHNVNPGDVEAKLLELPEVKDAAVIASNPSDPKLIAYVVYSESSTADRNTLRTRLCVELPSYMVPTVFVEVAELPYTVAGKVDRRSLPTPAATRSSLSDHPIAARTPIERLLHDIWSQVLRIKRVSIRDSFLDVGGDSIAATQVLSRVYAAFGLALPLPTLLRSATIERMANVILRSLIEASIGGQQQLLDWIDDAKPRKSRSPSDLKQVKLSQSSSPLPLARKIDRLSRARRIQVEELVMSARPATEPIYPRANIRFPLTKGQSGILFLEYFLPGTPLFHFPAALRLVGTLDFHALQNALDLLIERHEILRMCPVFCNGKFVFDTNPGMSLEMVTIVLDDVSEAALHQILRAESRRPFNINKGPLIRATLFAVATNEHVLLLVMHHLVSDWWSDKVLYRDLSELYAAFCQSRAPDLPVLQIQYGDYATWQNEQLESEAYDVQLAYWRENLLGIPQGLDLCFDRPRPSELTFSGARVVRTLARPLLKQLKNVARTHECTLFMVLAAAYGALLSAYSKQKDIVIGTPISGRNRPELENLIGFTANMLALRIDMLGDPTFSALLRRVRQITLRAYTHQEAPFELVVETIQPNRHMNRRPIFQVAFSLQTSPEVEMSLVGLHSTAIPVDLGIAEFDLTLSVTVFGESLSVELRFNTDLFDKSSVESFSLCYEKLLKSAVLDPKQPISRLAVVDAH